MVAEQMEFPPLLPVRAWVGQRPLSDGKLMEPELSKGKHRARDYLLGSGEVEVLPSVVLQHRGSAT